MPIVYSYLHQITKFYSIISKSDKVMPQTWGVVLLTSAKVLGTVPLILNQNKNNKLNSTKNTLNTLPQVVLNYLTTELADRKLKYGLFSRVISCHDRWAQNFKNMCSKCAPYTDESAYRQ